MVLNYKAAGSGPECYFYKSGSTIKTISTGNSAGNVTYTGGMVVSFNAGDTIYIGKPTDHGWDRPYFVLYDKDSIGSIRFSTSDGYLVNCEKSVLDRIQN